MNIMRKFRAHTKCIHNGADLVMENTFIKCLVFQCNVTEGENCGNI